MQNTPMTKLPDGSGCFTGTIMSREEAMALPLRERPLCFRISSELYHAVFEAIGAASMCWNPKPSNEVFDSSAAEKIAVDLCFKMAEELEKADQACDAMRSLTNDVKGAVVALVDDRLKDYWAKKFDQVLSMGPSQST